MLGRAELNFHGDEESKIKTNGICEFPPIFEESCAYHNLSFKDKNPHYVNFFYFDLRGSSLLPDAEKGGLPLLQKCLKSFLKSR